MQAAPYVFSIDLPSGRPTTFTHHVQRTLSAMEGQYLDLQAYQEMIKKGDPLLYEIYELSRPEVPGELIHGISILRPGRVGSEYNMTKGHFHTILETAEIYHCLHGQGFIVMETLAGDTCVEAFLPGIVLYVPPGWAHRSVNTSPDQNLVSFFAYPGNAGHDYGTIETQGFRKLVVEKDGQPAIIDNPRWLAPERRSG